jgi:hypothetical protein
MFKKSSAASSSSTATPAPAPSRTPPPVFRHIIANVFLKASDMTNFNCSDAEMHALIKNELAKAQAFCNEQGIRFPGELEVFAIAVFFDLGFELLSSGNSRSYVFIKRPHGPPHEESATPQ